MQSNRDQNMENSDELIEIPSPATNSSLNNNLSPTQDAHLYAIRGNLKTVSSTVYPVATISRSLVATYTPPVTEMKLNLTLAGILGPSPVVSTMLTQIPMSYYINRDGGKKQILFLIAATTLGILTITILSLLTDITTINSFDWRYIIMLIAGYLVGLGSGLFPLFIAVIKYCKPEQIPFMQSLYAAIVDSSSITTSPIIYFLKSYGYVVPFALYTIMIVIAGVIALNCYHEPPYNQYRRKYSKERAKELALEFGQIEAFIQDEDIPIKQKLKDHLKLLIDPRAMAINAMMFDTLGCFFVTETFFSKILKEGYKINTRDSILFASGANFITIVFRAVAGKLITKYDPSSSGVKIFLLGCALTVAAAIPLTFANLPIWLLCLATAIINIGFAFTLTPSFNIALKQAKPRNEKYAEYNPNDMIGLMSTIGTLGGIILPIIMGLMVDNFGQAGYQYYFLLLIALTVITGIALAVVDYDVCHKQGERFYDKPITLFGQSRASKYVFSGAYGYEPPRP